MLGGLSNEQIRPAGVQGSPEPTQRVLRMPPASTLRWALPRARLLEDAYAAQLAVICGVMPRCSCCAIVGQMAQPQRKLRRHQRQRLAEERRQPVRGARKHDAADGNKVFRDRIRPSEGAATAGLRWAAGSAAPSRALRAQKNDTGTAAMTFRFSSRVGSLPPQLPHGRRPC